jgi:hypothetical protein
MTTGRDYKDVDALIMVELRDEIARLRAENKTLRNTSVDLINRAETAETKLTNALAKLDDMLDLKPEPMRMAIKDLILDLAKERTKS